MPIMSAAYAYSKQYLRTELTQNVHDDLLQVWKQLVQHPHAVREGWTVVRFESEFLAFKQAIGLKDYGLNDNGAFSDFALQIPSHLWYVQFAKRWPTVLWAGQRLTTCTSSASSCETLWGHMEWIHSKKRNRMAHTLCERLLRAHANLLYMEHATDPWFVVDWEIDMLIEEPEEVQEEEDDGPIDMTTPEGRGELEDTRGLEVLARAAAPAAQAPAAQPAARRSGRARQTPGGLGGFAACMAEMIAVREGRLGRPAGPHGIV